MFLRKYSTEAKRLRIKRKELEDEYLGFYADLIINLCKLQPRKLYVVGFFEEKNNMIYDVEEGVIIEDGIPYYVNKERGIKEKLKDPEDIKLAVKMALGELLLLVDPQRVVSDVLSQLVRDREHLRTIGF